MVWDCSTWWNDGPLKKIDGIMKKEKDLHILKTNLPDFMDKCAYPISDITFQQDGYSKPTAKIVKSSFHDQSSPYVVACSKSRSETFENF